MHNIWPLMLVTLLYLHFTLAALVNTTIDDKFGDPETGALISYSPAVSWNDGTACTGCTAKPNASQAYMSTWHDGTYALSNVTNDTPGSILSASIPFIGTAVYVYCIIGHTFTSPDANTDMLFLLDGQPVGTYTLAPTGETNYDFNVPVYVNKSLPSGAHTVSIETGHGGQKALVLLDYVVYTHDDGKQRKNPAIIVGAVVGPVVLILIILAAVFTKRYLHKKQGKPYALDLAADRFSGPRPMLGTEDLAHRSRQRALTNPDPFLLSNRNAHNSGKYLYPLPPLLHTTNSSEGSLPVHSELPLYEGAVYYPLDPEPQRRDPRTTLADQPPPAYEASPHDRPSPSAHEVYSGEHQPDSSPTEEFMDPSRRLIGLGG